MSLEFPSDERDPLTYRIIGAALAVHNYLGTGFLEHIYQDALEIELKMRRIPYVREAPISVFYKGIQLKGTYKADFICFNSVIVELKALQRLSGTEGAQVIHYLRATGLHKGLLLNFGTKELGIDRYVY